jgi:hypothetical protein
MGWSLGLTWDAYHGYIPSSRAPNGWLKERVFRLISGAPSLEKRRDVGRCLVLVTNFTTTWTLWRSARACACSLGWSALRF